jgi:division protein CdvB (Snf7/Vps24/ESCRT-III family)
LRTVQRVLSSNNFSNKWQTDRSKEPLAQKIKQTVSPPGDLKRKLSETDRALGSQIVKLDKTITKMGTKEKNLFSKTSAAFQRHDTLQANAYANELSELRKAIKLVEGAKLSLESVQGRLKTITDIGDLAMVIAPVGQVVRTVRKTLMVVMPSANETMGDINSTLSGLMQEIGGISGSFGFDTGQTSEDAEKILAEASAVAETKMSSVLPTLPDLADPETTSADAST